MPEQSTTRRIEITPFAGRITVAYAGKTIADTAAALALAEGDYPTVYYLPETDIDKSVLEASDHRTHCPYKGDASYYHLNHDGLRAENAVWTYLEPIGSVSELRHHVAFYPDKVSMTVKAGA